MKKRNNILQHTQHISSLNDLRMQKLRLEMGMDFLEERLDDNIDLAREKLSPGNLAGAAIDKVIGSKDTSAETTDKGFMGVFVEVFLNVLRKLL